MRTSSPSTRRQISDIAVVVALLIAGSALYGSGVSAQDARSAAPPPRAEKLEPHSLRPMFDALIDAIENRFVNVDKLKEVNWRGRAEAAWPDVAKASTAIEAAPRINALLAELRTSHTQVFTPDEPEYYIIADVFGQTNVVPEVWGGPAMMPSLGAFTAKFDTRDHISHILEGSPADQAGLKVGDEIVSVDGATYQPIASFRQKVGLKVSVEIRRAVGGPTQKLDVAVVMLQPTLAFERATSNSARVIEKNGKRIGYIHLWQMRDKDSLANALETIDVSRRTSRRSSGARNATGNTQALNETKLAPLKSLDALIVDNRTKIGGQADVGRAYLETLGGGRGGTIETSSRRSDRTQRSSPKSFTGRSVMLIDSGTRSAAELFAFGFAHEKMGPLIGTKTAGAVTGAAAQMLPGGLLLYIGVADVTIDGQRLEGIGVAPTTDVVRPIPYSGGADPVLDAAIERLANQR